MFKNNLDNRKKGLIAACLTAATWSVLSIFLKFALNYIDSYSVVWYRMLVASTALLLWFVFSKNTKDLIVLISKPGALLLAALCLSVNYVAFMQGVHFGGPATAQIFIQLGPLLLAVAGLLIFKEKLSPKQLIGFSFCFLGFGLFFSDRMSHASGNREDLYLGLIWIFFAAITWAIFASIQKKLLNFWKSSQINIYIYLIASIIYLPFVNWQALYELPLSIHLFLFFLGLNTVLAYGCLSVALKYLPATQVSPIITMNPLLTLVFISIIDWMQWGFIPADPIGLTGYIGAIIAIVGILFVLAKKVRPKSERS